MTGLHQHNQPDAIDQPPDDSSDNFKQVALDILQHEDLLSLQQRLNDAQASSDVFSHCFIVYLFEQAQDTTAFDKVKMILSSNPQFDYGAEYAYHLLSKAIDLNSPQHWQFLMDNGVTDHISKAEYQTHRPIHHLTSSTIRFIRHYILMSSKPLIVQRSERDTAYVRKVLKDDPSLFVRLLEKIKFTSIKFFLECLDSGIDICHTDIVINILQIASESSKAVDGKRLSLRLHRVIQMHESIQVHHLTEILNLFFQAGAVAEAGPDTYDLLCRLCSTQPTTEETRNNPLTKAISTMLRRNMVPVNGNDEWNATSSPPVMLSLSLKNYEITELLFDYGATIPSSFTFTEIPPCPSDMLLILMKCGHSPFSFSTMAYYTKHMAIDNILAFIQSSTTQDSNPNGPKEHGISGKRRNSTIISAPRFSRMSHTESKIITWAELHRGLTDRHLNTTADEFTEFVYHLYTTHRYDIIRVLIDHGFDIPSDLSKYSPPVSSSAFNPDDQQPHQVPDTWTITTAPTMTNILRYASLSSSEPYLEQLSIHVLPYQFIVFLFENINDKAVSTLLCMMLSSNPRSNYGAKYAYHLLSKAIDLNSMKHWQSLIDNGVTDHLAKAEYQSHRPIHHITSSTIKSIRDDVLASSRPLFVQHSARDMEYAENVLKHYPSLFVLLVPKWVDFTEPAPFSRLLDTAFDLHHIRVVHLLLSRYSRLFLNSDTDKISEYVNSICKMFDRAPRSDMINIISIIFKHHAVPIDDYWVYDILTKLCSLDSTWQKYSSQLVQIISQIAKRGLVPLGGDIKRWRSHPSATPLAKAFTTSFHKAAELLLDYGAPIPPSMSFTEIPPCPTSLLLKCMQHGHSPCTFPTMVYYAKHNSINNILPLIQSSDSCDKMDDCDDSDTATSTVTWTQLRSTLHHSNDIRLAFTELIYYLLSKGRHDVIDALVRHGYDFPSDLSQYSPTAPTITYNMLSYCIAKWNYLPQTTKHSISILQWKLTSHNSTSEVLALYHFGIGLSKTHRDVSLITNAAATNDVGLVQTVLDGLGPYLDKSSFPLPMLAQASSTSVMRLLLYDTHLYKLLNDSDQSLRTALCHARDDRMAQLLIDSGADVNAFQHQLVDHHGTKRHSDVNALGHDYTTIIKFDEDYQLSERCLFWTPFHVAIRRRNWSLVRCFVLNHMDLNPSQVNVAPLTLPLAIAAFDDVNKTRWLLEHGADVFYNDPGGYCSFYTACRLHNDDIIRLLVAYGVDPTLDAHIHCLVSEQRWGVLKQIVPSYALPKRV